MKKVFAMTSQDLHRLEEVIEIAQRLSRYSYYISVLKK